jgi:GNAT superfamily N-acetyltransferase
MTTDMATARPVDRRCIRLLRPGDEGPVRDVFAGMAPHSRYLRFHAPMPRLTAAMLRRLTAVRPGQHVALVASVSGRDVGIARWVRDADVPHRADVGVSVVDAHQGRGVGRVLLETLARDAECWGVAELSCAVHRDNLAMLRLLHSWGASVVCNGDVCGAVLATALMNSAESASTARGCG